LELSSCLVGDAWTWMNQAAAANTMGARRQTATEVFALWNSTRDLTWVPCAEFLTLAEIVQVRVWSRKMEASGLQLCNAFSDCCLPLLLDEAVESSVSLSKF
jgi:hypothetical protein